MALLHFEMAPSGAWGLQGHHGRGRKGERGVWDLSGARTSSDFYFTFPQILWQTHAQLNAREAVDM